MIVSKFEPSTECTYYLKPYQVVRSLQLTKEAKELERKLKAGLEQSLEAQWRWQFGQFPVHYEYLKAVERYKRLYQQAVARHLRRRLGGAAACRNIQSADLRIVANEVTELAEWRGHINLVSPCGRNEARVSCQDGTWTLSQRIHDDDGIERSSVYRNVTRWWVERELTMGHMSIGWRVRL